MMKKMIRTTATLALALVLVFALLTLASCGKKELSGTYVSAQISMTFDGDRVTLRNSHYTGTAKYSIKDEGEKTYFYITFDEGEYDFDMDSRYRFEQGDGYITIGGHRLEYQPTYPAE